jgi:hypothetical protein
LALPEFQRPFVWEPSRVIDLLDSVLNGWPIGSLLVLEGPQPFRIREIDGAPDVYENEVELYLLDGQQRVTALYHALTGTSKTVYFADFTEPDEDGRPKLKWAPRSSYRLTDTSRDRIAFEALLHADRFGELVQSVDRLQAEWMIEARRLFSDEDARGSYAIPAIVMEQSISLEALTRIFETLNRTGVRLNSFDLMVAVLYPSGFNLRDEWELARAEHELLELFNVSGLEILKLIALWQRDIDSLTRDRPASRRVTGIRQRDVLNVPPHSVESHWGRAVRTYSDALRLMHDEFGVRDGDGVPSDAMVLGIAYFLDAGQHVSRISQWYWAAIATQSYAQGANTQILTDIRADTPSSVSVDVTRASLSAALVDETRRNKILRLGLRGLAILHGDLDPVTRAPLGGSAVEISYSSLVDGRVAVDGDAPVAGLLFIDKESLQILRKRRLSAIDPAPSLDVVALSTQGFVLSANRAPAVNDVQLRANFLAARLEARLS